jgi:glycine betaine/proline transport system substrate-binding protein
MTRIAVRVIIGAAIIGIASGFASASRVDEEPIQCKTVAFSNTGEAGTVATTAAASVLLEALGYRTDIKAMLVPATYSSLKSGIVDVFLGTPVPATEADAGPYRSDGSVQTVVSRQDGADVFTDVRKGYLDECKNVGKLLKNMSFPSGSVADINAGTAPETAARKWLKANQGLVDGWLKGVKAWDGKTDGRKAVGKAL